MDIGKRISDLRKKRGMTQEQLAEKLGTTRQAVSKWEADKSFPDIDHVVKMGTIFQVSMDYLLLGKENVIQEQMNMLEAPKTHSKDGCKLYRVLFAGLTLIGGAVLLLLPLFASMYRSLDIGPRYVNANVYLSEWPMVGVVILGVILAICGIVGLFWTYKKEDE